MPHANCRILVVAAVLALVPQAGTAQTKLKIFDAHLHCNQEPTASRLALDQVSLTSFVCNNVAGIIRQLAPQQGHA